MDFQSYLGHSSETEIRLTKFGSLAKIDNHQSAEMHDDNSQFEQVPTSKNYLAHSNNFDTRNICGAQNWSRLERDSDGSPRQAGNFNGLAQTGNSVKFMLDPSQLHEEYDAARGAAKAQPTEPFQVIWSKLAFEVDTRTYDQLLGRTLNRIRSIVSCSSGYTNENQRDIIGSSNVKLTQSTSSLQESSGKRVIFDNLNGHIKSGEISAILGPSGAGKTSLINAICSKASANYRGQVRLVGGNLNHRLRVSVIPQKDHLVDRLTVRENLLFASRMLNTGTDFDHEANILRIAKMLNMLGCLESSTGNISGGEYKRLSIGQELIKRPDILILDEPTTGLDWVNCKNLIKSLRSLIDASRHGAINPIAIVLTIHQPDVKIFHMFDHIYCMAGDGRTIYEGHPSKALEVIRSESGLSNREQDQPAEVNPANWLIEIASESVNSSAAIERLNKFQLKQFEQLDLSKQSMTTNGVDQKLNKLKCAQNNFTRDKRLNSKVDHGGKFWHQMLLLTKRNLISTIRDPLLTGASIMFHLLFPFGLWIMFAKEIGTSNACPVIYREIELLALTSEETASKMMNLQEETVTAFESSTMLFCVTLCCSLRSLTMAALSFPLSMHFMKESRNGWYGTTAYVLAKTTAGLLTEVLLPVISVIMIYMLTSMPDSPYHWRLWTMALVMALVSLISTVQGLIWGALFMKSIYTAISLSISSIFPLLMLSGFASRMEKMPQLLQHISWLSFFRYSTGVTTLVRFGFGLCPCNEAMDEYLKTQTAIITDLPDSMRPLIIFYLANNVVSDDFEQVNATSVATKLAASDDMQVTPQQRQQIAGIGYDLILNSTVRNNMIKRLESEDSDLFGKMAEFISKSFTFGRRINGCDSVRSQVLINFDAPPDNHLPAYLGVLVLMLVLFNILLFLVVRYRISRH